MNERNRLSGNVNDADRIYAATNQVVAGAGDFANASAAPLQQLQPPMGERGRRPSIPELQAAYQTKLSQTATAGMELQQAQATEFDRIDANHDGLLSRAEYRDAQPTLPHHPNPFSAQAIAATAAAAVVAQQLPIYTAAAAVQGQQQQQQQEQQQGHVDAELAVTRDQLHRSQEEIRQLQGAFPRLPAFIPRLPVKSP